MGMIRCRFLLLLFLLGISVFASSIDRKIQNSRHRLSATKSAYANMDIKLASIAGKISKNQTQLSILDNTISKLEKEILQSSADLNSSLLRLAKIGSEIKDLNQKRKKQEKRLVDMIANQYLLDEIKHNRGVQTTDDIIEKEALSALIKTDRKNLHNMQISYAKTLRQSRSLHNEARRLNAKIAMLQSRKKQAAKEKRDRFALSKKLIDEKKLYQMRMRKLQNEADSLRSTLGHLNILKEQARRKKSFVENRANKQIIASADKLHIRKIGSSYRRYAVGHYRGAKTISPVGRARVVQKFGSYIDPVYKIKIFNDSVTLEPYRSDAKVKNVLNGRVVFAKNTPVLGNIVIVEHKNNLHTIYAKMDKIAPTIKEGKKIRKGYVIGRVKKELMFEVTQKNRNINPLQLITLRR